MRLENVGEAAILAELERVLTLCAGERNAGGPLGDFLIRAGYVQQTPNGRGLTS